MSLPNKKIERQCSGSVCPLYNNSYTGVNSLPLPIDKFPSTSCMSPFSTSCKLPFDDACNSTFGYNSTSLNSPECFIGTGIFCPSNGCQYNQETRKWECPQNHVQCEFPLGWNSANKNKCCNNEIDNTLDCSPYWWPGNLDDTNFDGCYKDLNTDPQQFLTNVCFSPDINRNLPFSSNYDKEIPYLTKSNVTKICNNWKETTKDKQQNNLYRSRIEDYCQGDNLNSDTCRDDCKLQLEQNQTSCLEKYRTLCKDKPNIPLQILSFDEQTAEKTKVQYYDRITLSSDSLFISQTEEEFKWSKKPISISFVPSRLENTIINYLDTFSIFYTIGDRVSYKITNGEYSLVLQNGLFGLEKRSFQTFRDSSYWFLSDNRLFFIDPRTKIRLQGDTTNHDYGYSEAISSGMYVTTLWDLDPYDGTVYGYDPETYESVYLNIVNNQVKLEANPSTKWEIKGICLGPIAIMDLVPDGEYQISYPNLSGYLSITGKTFSMIGQITKIICSGGRITNTNDLNVFISKEGLLTTYDSTADNVPGCWYQNIVNNTVVQTTLSSSPSQYVISDYYCIENCDLKNRYKCVDKTCVKTYGGPFTSLDCNGTCDKIVEDGIYLISTGTTYLTTISDIQGIDTIDDWLTTATVGAKFKITNNIIQSNLTGKFISLEMVNEYRNLKMSLGYDRYIVIRKDEEATLQEVQLVSNTDVGGGTTESYVSLSTIVQGGTSVAGEGWQNPKIWTLTKVSTIKSTKLQSSTKSVGIQQIVYLGIHPSTKQLVPTTNKVLFKLFPYESANYSIETPYVYYKDKVLVEYVGDSTIKSCGLSSPQENSYIIFNGMSQEDRSKNCECVQPDNVYNSYINKLPEPLRTALKTSQQGKLQPECFYPPCADAANKIKTVITDCPSYTICIQNLDIDVGGNINSDITNLQNIMFCGSNTFENECGTPDINNNLPFDSSITYQGTKGADIICKDLFNRPEFESQFDIILKDYCVEGNLGKSICKTYCSKENVKCEKPCAKCVNGICNDGVCVCTGNWEGEACDKENKCKNIDCGNHGVCSDGTCVCEESWKGRYCEEEIIDKCKNVNCGNYGVCQEGVCVCEDGYEGKYCDEEIEEETDLCEAVDCGNHGVCQEGVCVCEESWKGNRCEEEIIDKCKNINCGNYGVCQEGVCVCQDGWKGTNCEEEIIDKCKNVNCGAHGTCSDGYCVCQDQYTGEYCQNPPVTPEKDCDNNSECGHGDCVNGYCVCQDGYEGKYCESEINVPDCFNNSDCGGNECKDGKCVCPDNKKGIHCEQVCDLKCKNGTCKFKNDKKICECIDGFSGELCDEEDIEEQKKSNTTSYIVIGIMVFVIGMVVYKTRKSRT